MKTEASIQPRTCPFCGKEYTAPSALSRLDNTTEICPECGQREALRGLGISDEEIETIISLVRDAEEEYNAEH